MKSKKKDFNTADMTDYPLSSKRLKRLQKSIGFTEDKKHNLFTLNMDERSMFSHRLLAWCNQRFWEATADFENNFGSIPIVNFFGDLGQLGPVDAKDLHTPPSKSAAPDQLKGYSVYQTFTECVVLTQTMRQKLDQIGLLERLLRIRSGNVTQQDWININLRHEQKLKQSEKEAFQNGTVITLHETWREVKMENRKQLSQLGVPVAVIPSTGRGRHHKKSDKQVGRIPARCIIAVGCTVMLTRNQGPHTVFGLNNGAIGSVVSILYSESKSPPSMPDAVIVNFEGYSGKPWIDGKPKWIPIVPQTSRCDHECCSRTYIPLIAAYSISIAKSQGMTVGERKPATHMRIKLQSEKFMEALSLGTSYTAFSRVESENRWCLVDEVPMDRILYINEHPHMQQRRDEENRLEQMSALTVANYFHYADGIDAYLDLLQRFDVVCGDGLVTSICQSNSHSCTCIICHR